MDLQNNHSDNIPDKNLSAKYFEKQCKTCKKFKLKSQEFYSYQGNFRSECKDCCIKKNGRHQKLTKPWLKRETKKEQNYDPEYYKRNKDKFAAYRATFLEKHPGYNRDYYLAHKDGK